LLSLIAIAIGSRATNAHLDAAMAADLFLLGSRMKSIYPLSRYVIIAATGGILAVTNGLPADSAGLSEKS
jgi:hypothetical protein